jgi:hypothetical protein
MSLLPGRCQICRNFSVSAFVRLSITLTFQTFQTRSSASAFVEPTLLSG